MKARLAFTLLLGLASACAARTPPPTPEPTLTVEEEAAQYVRTYGGSESQYRIILMAQCPELANLMEGAMGRLDTEPELSAEWREALGYSNAINSRQLDLDC